MTSMGLVQSGANIIGAETNFCFSSPKLVDIHHQDGKAHYLCVCVCVCKEGAGGSRQEGKVELQIDAFIYVYDYKTCISSILIGGACAMCMYNYKV